MKLVWHIVLKDLRRLRLALALWALFPVAQIGVGLGLFLGGIGAKPESFNAMGSYYAILTALNFICSYLLIAVLLQEDSLVGSGVFWRTRPISGARLFAAKLIAAALMFGLLPVLIWLPWWLTCGYGWREVAGAVPQILGVHAAVVLLAMLVAVLTENFSRFLAWTLMLTVTLATLWLAVISGAGMRGDSTGASAGLTETRIVLALAIVLAVAAIAVVLQFLGRRPAWTFALVLAGLGLGAPVAYFWTEDLSPAVMNLERNPPIKDVPALTEGISFTFDQALIQPLPRDDVQSLAFLFVGLTPHGLPEGMQLSGRWAQQSWQWNDRSSVNSANGGGVFYSENILRRKLGLPSHSEDLGYRLWREERSFQGRYDSSFSAYWMLRDRENMLFLSGSVPRSAAARIRSEPSSYTARVSLLLSEPKILWEQPLQPAERHWTGTASERLLRVARWSTEWQRQIVLLESQPTSWLDTLRRLDRVNEQRLGEESRARERAAETYLLVNRRRGNLAMTYYSPTPLYIGTVAIRSFAPVFTSPRKWLGEGRSENEADWFLDATLVKTTTTEVARFEREVKVDHFEVQP